MKRSQYIEKIEVFDPVFFAQFSKCLGGQGQKFENFLKYPTKNRYRANWVAPWVGDNGLKRFGVGEAIHEKIAFLGGGFFSTLVFWNFDQKFLKYELYGWKQLMLYETSKIASIERGVDEASSI